MKSFGLAPPHGLDNGSGRTRWLLVVMVYMFGTLLMVGNSMAQDKSAQKTSPAEIQENIPDAALVGEDMFTYYFWDVYLASLYAPSGKFDIDSSFALRLKYQRDLEGKKIAQRSIDEIKKQSSPSKEQASMWLAKMEAIFPDVSDGDVLTGIALKDGTSIFYFNGEKVDSIDDAEFTTQFFNIWLGEKTSEPKFRKALLGNS
ncbi:chalcone isomerase family protein [Alteromonas gracilis]|uniref:chalcone isomerase family protein n=1 Tax=Alteromonas gracilis TaxID=1479524 RepID=UPI0030CFB096